MSAERNNRPHIETRVAWLEDNKAGVPHTDTTGTYGKGSSEVYGHVKLTSVAESDTLGVENGFAATPKAVYDAKVAANAYTDSKVASANSTAASAVTTANAALAKAKEAVAAVGTLKVYPDIRVSTYTSDGSKVYAPSVNGSEWFFFKFTDSDFSGVGTCNGGALVATLTDTTASESGNGWTYKFVFVRIG